MYFFYSRILHSLKKCFASPVHIANYNEHCTYMYEFQGSTWLPEETFQTKQTPEAKFAYVEIQVMLTVTLLNIRFISRNSVYSVTCMILCMKQKKIKNFYTPSTNDHMSSSSEEFLISSKDIIQTRSMIHVMFYNGIAPRRFLWKTNPSFQELYSVGLVYL